MRTSKISSKLINTSTSIALLKSSIISILNISNILMRKSRIWIIAILKIGMSLILMSSINLIKLLLIMVLWSLYNLLSINLSISNNLLISIYNLIISIDIMTHSNLIIQILIYISNLLTKLSTNSISPIKMTNSLRLINSRSWSINSTLISTISPHISFFHSSDSFINFNSLFFFCLIIFFYFQNLKLIFFQLFKNLEILQFQNLKINNWFFVLKLPLYLLIFRLLLNFNFWKNLWINFLFFLRIQNFFLLEEVKMVFFKLGYLVRSKVCLL